MIYDAVVVLKNGNVKEIPVHSCTGYAEAAVAVEGIGNHGIWLGTTFFPASMIDHICLPEKKWTGWQQP